MKITISNALTSISLAVIALVGGPCVAQTIANGPYYATPSWDQTLPASTRFIVLSNFNSDAVLDRETGLVWERALGSSSGDGPSVTCARTKAGGRAGWRAPTISELGTLFDPLATSVPPLPTGHPFLGFPAVTGSSAVIILSSTSPGVPGVLLSVLYQGGPVRIDFAFPVTFVSANLLCVRGPGG
jgi:hypothetical protein